MKKTKIPFSKRTLALLAVTLLLIAGGSITGSKAALTYFSEDYIADFKLDHIQVHLIENGKDVCEGKNGDDSVHGTYTGVKKVKGNLLNYLGYKADLYTEDTAAYKIKHTMGEVEPGRTYEEKIKARNGQNIPQYLRLTVKKYWVNTETGKKDTRLDPKLIDLNYSKNRSEGYNSGPWIRNKKESTPESETYYYNKILPKHEDTPLLFDELTIDKAIMKNMTKKPVKTTETTTQDGNKTVTVYTYSYDYNGYAFYIEADVQAIQTHNINDAISSLWGVSNVSAANGKLTVK